MVGLESGWLRVGQRRAGSYGCGSWHVSSGAQCCDCCAPPSQESPNHLLTRRLEKKWSLYRRTRACMCRSLYRLMSWFEFDQRPSPR